MTKQQKLQNIKNDIEEKFKKPYSTILTPMDLEVTHISLTGSHWKFVITGVNQARAEEIVKNFVKRTTSAHLPVSFFKRTVEIIYK